VLNCRGNNLTTLNLGSNINLQNLSGSAAQGWPYFDTRGNAATLQIKVGTSSRVIQAQSLFTTTNLNIDSGTTFTT